MKKIFIAFCVLLVWSVSSAFTTASMNPSTTVPSGLKAADMLITVGKNGEKISLLELSTISRKSLEKITGKKMNLSQRLAFRGAQKKLQHGINSDGVVTDKKIKKMFYGDGGSGFNLGGFALGFLIGPLGVLIAYLINDDLKSSRVKWAWIGFGIGLVLGLVLILSVF